MAKLTTKSEIGDFSITSFTELQLEAITTLMCSVSPTSIKGSALYEILEQIESVKGVNYIENAIQQAVQIHVEDSFGEVELFDSSAYGISIIIL